MYLKRIKSGSLGLIDASLEEDINAYESPHQYLLKAYVGSLTVIGVLGSSTSGNGGRKLRR